MNNGSFKIYISLYIIVSTSIKELSNQRVQCLQVIKALVPNMKGKISKSKPWIIQQKLFNFINKDDYVR